MEKLRKAMMIVFVVGILSVPVISIAGSLEPSGAPAPTMKTLDQIPPTWSQKLPAAIRFELVLDGTAVLDKETGLVWERSPGFATDVSYTTIWGGAIAHCVGLEVGGRKGWHLPTSEQLASLVDKSSAGILKLPDGHPFNTNCSLGACVQPDYYWTASTSSNNPTQARTLNFSSGDFSLQDKATTNHFFWCVRGGQSYDAY